MAAPTADIGLIGLAVMGENLVLNMESHGYTVAVYNRTTDKVDEFVDGRGKGKKFVGAKSPEEFVASIKRPRKVMMMVKAGQAVDDTIAEVAPLLEQGDILIDGGNTHFPDTTRRMKALAAKGILFVGTGVSGGEEGALKGPSIMPGGDATAWPEVKPIFQAIAAKVKDSDGKEAAVLRLGRAGGGRALRQDGPQRHRVRRHAAHLRVVPPAEGPAAGWRRAELQRGVRQVEQGRARQLPDRDHRRHPRRTPTRRPKQADGRPDPRHGRAEGHRQVDRRRGHRQRHRR